MTRSVTVYWRPGCPYSSRLLNDLDRIGLPIRKIDIRQDPVGAAHVRSLAVGNETVPTVVIGDEHAMINPRPAEVVEAVRAQAPGLFDEISSAGLARIANGSWQAGLGFSAFMAVIWLALAMFNPTTTYHFAPVIVAAAWPAGCRLHAARALPARPAVTTALGGGLLALAATALLSTLDALAGPALFGLPDGLSETLAAVALGVCIGVTFAVVRRGGKPAQRGHEEP